ncbi:MAG: glycosyltransferase family 25 protein [Bacteroidia bacterium]|nr:glycosyltransferase family 25 protein [Bacteroidia bacterium]
MKLYYISFPRFPERYRHIRNELEKVGLMGEPIEAVDGALLTEKDLEELCDVEEIHRYGNALLDANKQINKHKVGATLSHHRFYKALISSPDKAGCVLEDDVILPMSFRNILMALEKELEEDELVLLYAGAHQDKRLSKRGAKFLGRIDGVEYGLYYPMTPNVASAVAYCIGRKAAQRLLAINTPIKCTVDLWEYYYKRGAFSRIRIVYPLCVGHETFRSTISYPALGRWGRMRAYVRNVIESTKFPLLYNLLRWRRGRVIERLAKFYLVDEESPIAKGQVPFPVS